MIVIPMAGLSRRFSQAGYTKPKYMLPLHGGTVFDHAVGSFNHYFDSEPILVVARDIFQTPAFVEERSKALGIRNLQIAILDRETAGQAETVALGLVKIGCAGNSPVTIFNIDTFRPGFCYPTAPWLSRSAGYLEVFEGQGANWSYVRPAAERRDECLVSETAEKRAISNLCCTGLYHFARASEFLHAFDRERARPTSSELYVAPLYNHLIARGSDVHYHLIRADAVNFCGTPEEYEALLEAPVSGL